MKKTIITTILLLIFVMSTGCNKSTDDDIYDTDNETDTVSSDLNLTIDETDIESETVVTEEGITEVDTTEADTTKTDTTPREDVYEPASELIEFDYSEFEGIEPFEVTDEELIKELNKYMEAFYFNYYFTLGLEEDTGNITVDAMTLFALSYIMQYEYNELKFEHKTYTLYIPKEHVVNIVQKYFYKNLDVFNVYEDLKIDFEDDIYSVVVEDGRWDVEIKVTKVERLGDFTLRILCDVTNETTGRLKEQIEAVVDESQDGHVLINYGITIIEE